MQYVGQTGRALKKRFGEHYRRMNKPKKIDNFLYRHFKRKGHTPANILVQPVEKITYDANSTSRFKIIKRHETELKWIKLLQTPYPLGFNDNIYLEGNLSKMPDFDVFSLLEFRKRTARSHGIKKNGNCKRKSREFPFFLIPCDLAVRLRNSNKEKTSKSGILERLPSRYILSLNPSGYGVCRSLIHFNSVSCLLIILNLLVEFAS